MLSKTERKSLTEGQVISVFIQLRTRLRTWLT